MVLLNPCHRIVTDTQTLAIPAPSIDATSLTADRQVAVEKVVWRPPNVAVLPVDCVP